jgi:hypothetical protein
MMPAIAFITYFQNRWITCQTKEVAGNCRRSVMGHFGDSRQSKKKNLTNSPSFFSIKYWLAICMSVIY